MHAVAECQVPDALSTRVEGVGPIERGRIALCGGHEQHHRVALGKGDVPDRHLLRRRPPDQLHRRVVPQRLLDDHRGAIGITGELGPVLRLTQHHQDRVGDQVHRRLVARDQQQVARRDDLLGGQLVAVLLGRDQRRDQVLAGGGPSLLDQTGDVPTQPVPGLHAFVKAVGHLTGERDERVESLCQQRRRSAELRLVLDRHAQHPADHRDGQRMGQVGDGIEAACGRHLVEQ